MDVSNANDNKMFRKTVKPRCKAANRYILTEGDTIIKIENLIIDILLNYSPDIRKTLKLKKKKSTQILISLYLVLLIN